MDAERDKREARKNMYSERYSPPVVFGILMYGSVDKKKLGKTLFPNWRHILKTNNIYSNKNPHGIVVGIIVVHLFIEFRYRYTYIYTSI